MSKDEDKKEPDPIQRLRAAVDQAAMSAREIVPVLSTLYTECIKQGIDPSCASCLTQIYFNYILRPKFPFEENF